MTFMFFGTFQNASTGGSGRSSISSVSNSVWSRRALHRTPGNIAPVAQWKIHD